VNESDEEALKGLNYNLPELINLKTGKGMEIWIVSIILILAVYFLIKEKISVDLTSIGIMMVRICFC